MFRMLVESQRRPGERSKLTNRHMYVHLNSKDLFWLNANSIIEPKVIVYDAIVRANLLYGLKSTAMNEKVRHSLDVI